MQNAPTKFTAADTGCLIDSHYGHYAHTMLIELAVSCGMMLPNADAYIVARYADDNGLEEYPHEYVYDLADDADQWLNEHCAPDGFSFGWYDGDYFLAADAWWETDC